jgi:hypothetical protein
VYVCPLVIWLTSVALDTYHWLHTGVAVDAALNHALSDAASAIEKVC